MKGDGLWCKAGKCGDAPVETVRAEVSALGRSESDEGMAAEAAAADVVEVCRRRRLK